MELVMCRSCGKFVPAFPTEDVLKPLAEECPDCGGTEFKDNKTGWTTETREV